MKANTECEFYQRYRVSSDGCWLWLGSTDSSGYGQFRLNGRRYRAHRLSYLLMRGDITDGLHVLHRCDNPLCVNPDHLFLGTHQDNMDDKVRKGRQHRPIGVLCGGSKLTDEDVREIRLSSESGVVLGKKYGVSRTTISHIRRNKTWSHVI